jgi:hypothetical protein
MLAQTRENYHRLANQYWQLDNYKTYYKVDYTWHVVPVDLNIVSDNQQMCQKTPRYLFSVYSTNAKMHFFITYCRYGSDSDIKTWIKFKKQRNSIIRIFLNAAPTNAASWNI